MALLVTSSGALETAGAIALLVPGLGALNYLATGTNATINVASGYEVTTQSSTPTLTAGSTVALAAGYESTSESNVPTVSAGGGQSSIGVSASFIGPRTAVVALPEHFATAGFSAEPNGYVQGGLPAQKSARADLDWLVAARNAMAVTKSVPYSGAAYAGAARMNFVYSANKTGGGLTVVRDVSTAIGARTFVGVVPDKQISMGAYGGPTSTIIATATQNGGAGGGSITPEQITLIAQTVTALLGTAPPTGLIQAIAGETITQYRNDPIETGLKRVEAERLWTAATTGPSFNIPNGVVPVGHTFGYFNWTKTKQRITNVYDGTRNRVIQSYDLSDD